MGDFPKQEDLRQQVKTYADVRDVYVEYGNRLEEILKSAVKIHAPLAIVEARAKTVASFAEKAARKWSCCPTIRIS